MAQKIITLFLTAAMLLVISSAQAVQVRGMNTANVPVADRSDQSLQKALQTAFNQVLVKMSGNTSVSTVPAVQNASSNINNLVVSYSYSTQTNAAGNSQLMLYVVFDGSAMKHLLKNAGQSIWSSDRPLTLIWLSVSQGVQNNVISSGDSSPIITSIKQVTEQRGVPIIFPTMDLQDQANIASTPAQLPSSQQLTTSVQRYGVKSALAGSIINNGSEQFQGEWKLLLNGTPYEWQTNGMSVEQVITNGINQAADMMANQLATIDSKNLQSTVMLQISGVENLDDYVHVVAALRRLADVSKVTVNDMSNDILLLEVNAAGGSSGLVSALKMVDHLTAEAAPADVGTNQANLFYHYSENTNQPINNGNDNNG